MTELRAAVASGVGWTAAQKWSLKVAGVLTFVVLGRLLGPSDIGLATLALACLGVVGVVADLGVTTFLVQTGSWDEETRSPAFWTAIVVVVAPHGLTALAWALSVDSLLTVTFGALALRRSLSVELRSLGRPAGVVVSGVLATGVALAVVHAGHVTRFPAAVLGGVVVVALVGAALWLTNAALLRRLAGDVQLLVRRRVVV